MLKIISHITIKLYIYIYISYTHTHINIYIFTQTSNFLEEADQSSSLKESVSIWATIWKGFFNLLNCLQIVQSSSFPLFCKLSPILALVISCFSLSHFFSPVTNPLYIFLLVIPIKISTVPSWALVVSLI